MNLFVGPNNAGKTSLLEAIELLASSSPECLIKGPSRRGERQLSTTEEDLALRPRSSSRARPDLSHLFRGHRLVPGVGFRVNSADRFVRCIIKDLALGFDRSKERQTQLFRVDFQLELSLEKVAELAFETLAGSLELFLRENGQLVTKPSRTEADSYQPWMTPSFLDNANLRNNHYLRELWDRVALEAEEEHILRALRIIEPRIERIAFLENQPYIRLHDEEMRLPLASSGDGMSRLLALALHLSQAENSVLLIDEIDTGLYYQVLPQMWRLVVETAARLGVQVFATTHSRDCIDALDELYRKQPDLAAQVLVHRIEPGASESVTYEIDEIVRAIEFHTEVR